MAFDRDMIEAAVRNGADITAGEAGALLAELDRRTRDLSDARSTVSRLELELGAANNGRDGRRIHRAREILTGVPADIPDPEAARQRAVDALDGAIR